MFPFFIFAFFFGCFLRWGLFVTSDLSRKLHILCLQQAPGSAFEPFYQAIVCGQKLDLGGSKVLLQETGLMHVMVISGMHLLFLSQLIRRLSPGRCQKSLEPALLLSQVFCCQIQAPALRAFLDLSLQRFSISQKLFFSSDVRRILSVALCLLANPSLIDSYSLPLSWLAALAMSLSRHSIGQSFFCWLILMPVVTLFSPVSPWSIAINGLLTPLIGALLYPMSLLTLLVSPLAPLTDLMWSFTFRFLQIISPSLTLGEVSQNSQPLLLVWIYCLVMQGLVCCHRILRKANG